VDMPSAQGFRAFYRDQWLGATDHSSGDILTPVSDWSSGDPLHLTIYALNGDGSVKTDYIWAIWVSFRHPWDASAGGHYCHLTAAAAQDSENFKYGFDSVTSKVAGDSNNCHLSKPQYKCWTSGWAESSDSVQYLQFLGTLVDMADGELINIHLDDDVDVDVPLTNNFVTHTVTQSSACDSVCKILVGQPTSDTWDTAIAGCQIEKSEINAKDTLGQVKVSGYGRINGFSLQAGSSTYGGGKHWDHDQPECDVKQGSQAALHGCEFAIMSGLLHLTQSQTLSPPGGQFPVDISEVAVAFSPAIGDAAVLINSQFKTEFGGGPANNAAKLFDVKTPGSFVDAADGPNLFGDGSQLLYCYLHHADDTVKVSASDSLYYRNTVLHGNTGSTILLGNFGLNLVGNKVTNADVNELFVHYIWQDGDETQGAGTYTGILGMQTCLNDWSDITLSDITVRNVYVPDLGEGKTRVNRVFGLGALDPGHEGGQGGFCARTNSPALYNVHLNNIYLTKWQVFSEPTAMSYLFANQDESGNQRGQFYPDNLQFFDPGCGHDYACIQKSAVSIYHRNADEGAYFVCATDTDSYNCMDAQNGAFWQQSNMCPGGVSGSAGCQNVAWSQVDVAGKVQFPWNDKASPWRRLSLRGAGSSSKPK